MKTYREIMEKQFELENIKCEGCESTIRKALIKMPGIENVLVNVAQSTVTVIGTPDTGAVLGKLQSLGYPEKGHNTLLVKAKSYISCAIGKVSK